MSLVISKYNFEVGEASVPYHILEYLDDEIKKDDKGRTSFDLRYVLPFQVPKLGPSEDVGRPYISEDCFALLDFKNSNWNTTLFILYFSTLPHGYTSLAQNKTQTFFDNATPISRRVPASLTLCNIRWPSKSVSHLAYAFFRLLIKPQLHTASMSGIFQQRRRLSLHSSAW